MSGLEIRTFDDADETTALEKAGMDVVSVGGQRVARYVFEPGWRFTEHFDANGCPAPHAAYVASGRLRILMDDGTEAEAGPGTVVTITPGHDAWTVGDEPCVFIDFGQSVDLEGGAE
jgi:quercetin dioxygenase-like cupin family protein